MLMYMVNTGMYTHKENSDIESIVQCKYIFINYLFPRKAQVLGNFSDRMITDVHTVYFQTPSYY